MSPTVCLAALTIDYPEGGGHNWVYLNWALGLRAQGCDVIWLETLKPGDHARALPLITALKKRLAPYGLDEALAVVSERGQPLPPDIADKCLTFEAATEADLLVNLWYQMPAHLVNSFRRTALLDIDPGLLQRWMTQWEGMVAPHDIYLTTGETVGRPDARFPDAGRDWHHLTPCIALDWWPVRPSEDDAPYTTVSHWQMGEYEYDGDEIYSNDKRTGFLPFIDLPAHTVAPLELALNLSEKDQDEADGWRRRGWRIRDSREVATTVQEYQAYIQSSRGEFSAVKPSCVRLQNAWISDRTLCYLASGKPAIIQDTGPSRVLPESGGLFRFHTVEQAAQAIKEIEENYDDHCKCARELAETHFDARTVATKLLEIGLA